MSHSSQGASSKQRPLYTPSRPDLLTERPRDGHAGLWYDKFCNTWQQKGQEWSLSSNREGENPKLAWIKTVTNTPLGQGAQLEEVSSRQLRLVAALGGESALCVTESRFVTGLGRNHPVENGFAWHHTLGVPYLPGSSVKGMARAWARSQNDVSPGELTRLLGDAERAGVVGFLDALPTKPVLLEAEMITPHYAGWDVDNPPGDWRSPTPIPFLVTAREQPFLFGIVPLSREHPATGAELARVLSWIIEALLWEGAGAKTSVGYGRFRHDEQATRALRERIEKEARQQREEAERQEAMQTPLGRWRLQLKGLSEEQLLEMVRVHLEKEPLEDQQERQALVQAILETPFPLHWKKGNKVDPRTKTGGSKLKQRYRLLEQSAPSLDKK